MVSIHLAVVTTHRGVAPRTVLTLLSLARLGNVAMTVSVYDYDVVRTRSFVACQFLKETRPSHLLFWDDDVALDVDANPRAAVAAIQQMLAAGVDFICTPYPKKCEPPDWPFVRIDGAVPQDGLLEIDRAPMGCTMLSRYCLERMWDLSDAYPMRDVRRNPDGTRTERQLRALFALQFRGTDMLPEDFSFSQRWREDGGKIYLNMASMAEHWGVKAYTAKP